VALSKALIRLKHNRQRLGPLVQYYESFAFAFDDFESLRQNFGLTWAHSKFGNFGLGNSESWKNQYHN
jgi:hypothetical protein